LEIEEDQEEVEWQEADLEYNKVSLKNNCLLVGRSMGRLFDYLLIILVSVGIFLPQINILGLIAFTFILSFFRNEKADWHKTEIQLFLRPLISIVIIAFSGIFIIRFMEMDIGYFLLKKRKNDSFLFNFSMMIVVLPLLEEYFYRFFLLGGLVKRIGASSSFSTFLIAALFSLSHFDLSLIEPSLAPAMIVSFLIRLVLGVFLGHLILKNNNLKAQVNSKERADLFRSIVEKRLPSSARYKITLITPIESFLEEQKKKNTKEVAAQSDLLQDHPELQEKMKDFMRDHWGNWINEKIPALKNKTPKQAARNKDGRERLEALLTQFERDAVDHPQPGQTMEIFQDLRKQLGIE